MYWRYLREVDRGGVVFRFLFARTPDAVTVGVRILPIIIEITCTHERSHSIFNKRSRKRPQTSRLSNCSRVDLNLMIAFLLSTRA